MEIKNEVINLICETLEVKKEELKEGQNLYDSIGVDSTEMVELNVTLKKHFGVEIEANEITKFSTLEDIVEIISKKRA